MYLSYLPCIWVTSRVSELPSVYLSYLPCIWVTFRVSELPPVYLSYLPCIWVTFHVSELPSAYPSYLPRIWVTFHVSELPSVYPSYLPCIRVIFRVSWVIFRVSWVIFHVSELPSMYPSYLPCIRVTFHVSELPSMYQQVWSATLCQLQSQQKRQRRRVSSFGIGFKGLHICFWSLEWRSREQNYLERSFSLDRNLSYLPSINKFGLPPSVSCPVNRNVNEEECLLLGISLKGYTSLFWSLESRSREQSTLRKVSKDTHLFFEV